jgi:anhydro-N-acetylmuramic acid kinase
MPDYFIGLISGTSMDGIDAALVSFGDASIRMHATHQHPYPGELRSRLRHAISEPQRCAVDEIGSLDCWTGRCFRDAALALLAKAGVDAREVVAIGSHGQTLRHQPDAELPFTLQIGDPSRIALGTGITTIADFRRADLAAGGQGAPLAPLFHEWLFRRDGATRVILNIGGIANITILHGDDTATTGFDTGPGNTLLDAWIAAHQDASFDRDGSWSAAGNVDTKLLSRLSADPYFAAPAPKSTGFEHFNLDWLRSAGIDSISPVDVQATLCQLSADTIAAATRGALSGAIEDVLVCGGGVHNRDLMTRLAAALPQASVRSSAAEGLEPDWIEAAAFAWLAMRNTRGLPGNLPSVTGASRKVILGATFAPR